MLDGLLQFVQSLPPLVAVFLMAALPISEIRGAVPLGLLTYNLPWVVVYIVAVFGNLLPVIPLYALLEVLRDFLFKAWPWLGRHFDRWLKRAHHKVKGQFDRYGVLALYIFTAIPFPLTGVYTATAGAILLKIPARKALPALAMGVLTSGLITSLFIWLGATLF